MSTADLIMWITIAAVGLVGSAIYSGLETGIYSLNRVRLQILDHQHNRAALAISRLLADPAVILSTLLVGNNLMNYMGTAALTVMLEASTLAEWQVVLANVLIVTPLLFVFGETLPKDLFARYSDSLTYRFAPLLTISHRVFKWTGLLPLVMLFSRAVTRFLHHSQARVPIFHPKRQVGVLVKEAVGHGLLSDEQSAIVERVLSLASRQVDDEMVPWSKVIHVREDDSTEVLWRLAERSSFSRMPVLAKDGRVLGLVSLYDALRHDQETCPPLRSMIQPMDRIDRKVPSREALAKLQKSHVAMSLVVDGDRPVGIVTIKDLVEPITGELASW